MKKFSLLSITLVVVVLFSVQFLPVAAQELETQLIPVSGIFNYIGTDLSQSEIDGHLFLDVVEEEVWTGDFEGTALSPFPFVAYPTGEREAWILTEFEGTVLGEYEGTLTMIAIYYKPAGAAHWHGRWKIVSGTDELEFLRGQGTAWGPGSGRAEEGEPHINYSGMVFFIEPLS